MSSLYGWNLKLTQPLSDGKILPTRSQSPENSGDNESLKSIHAFIKLRGCKLKSDSEIKEIVARLKKNGYWFWQKGILEKTDVKDYVESLENSFEQFQNILVQTPADRLVSALLDAPKPLGRTESLEHCLLATDMSAELLDRIDKYLKQKTIKCLHMKTRDGGSRKYKLKELGISTKGKINHELIEKADPKLTEDILEILCHGSEIDEFRAFSSFGRCRLGTICGNE